MPPLSDLAVLAAITLATILWVRWLWRRGVRGRDLLASGWLGFLGLVLIVTLLAHNVDIASRLIVSRGHDGPAFGYNFRFYSLQLLGVVLIGCGVQLVRAAAGLGLGNPAARGSAMRTLALVLLVVVPLIPIQAFFAIPLSVLGAVALLLVL